MFNKKLFSFLILIAVILSISSVSAIDADKGTEVINDNINLKTNVNMSDFVELTDKVNASDDCETPYLVNDCKTFQNSPHDLFLNSGDASVVNAVFNDESAVDSMYDVSFVDEKYLISDFDELSDEINSTPEGGVLVLNKNYEFINGSIKGILISKSITIDGAGHTLNGNRMSRIFNVTADNVTIKNVNFINGNSLGSYGILYGGGAIYWNGSNGHVENCNFTDNCLYSFEYDPYEEYEISVCDDGTVQVIKIDARPSGATTGQGGAIAWIGDEGKITNSTFRQNSVGYANNGGAIFWAGANGQIINSEFYDNNAYRGSAIYWKGANGTISLSTFLNFGICDNGIFWVGENGSIKYSILLSKYPQGQVISQYSVNVKADLNFWGDTVDNPNAVNKNSLVNYWVLMDYSADKDFVFEGDSFSVNYNLNTVTDKSANKYSFNGLASKAGSFNFTSNETGILDVSYIGNNPSYAVDFNSIKDINDLFMKQITYNVVAHNSSGDFYDLLIKIHDTPEGGILVLDKDYEFTTGFNKGILISKSITIDGAGHTLNGNGLSRIFNVKADNVTIKNVNFINGNAYGRYVGITGGGAIYWGGDNGYLFNCSFINNSGSGIEDNPFDVEEIGMDDNGMIWFIVRMSLVGAKINEGGAIAWNGLNGTVNKCLFDGNGVGYPNSGGAICWRGDSGKIIGSEFYNSDAWTGSAICWVGNNGVISSSIVSNSSFFNCAIFWFGENGTIINSTLIDTDSRSALRTYPNRVKADYNFWGDTIDNPNAIVKDENVSNWLVMKFSNNGQFVKKGQTVVIKYDITTLVDKTGNTSSYYGLVNCSSQITYRADKTGFLNITFSNGRINVNIDTEKDIKSKDLIDYYVNKIFRGIKVQDILGKNAKIKIKNSNNNSITIKDSIMALVCLKLGKYNVHKSHNDVKVKNKITVLSLIKNLSKKSVKSG